MTNYLINSVLCSVLFLLVYKLFLEKEKIHHFNRFYLIGAILASLIIPKINMKIKQNETINISQTLTKPNFYVTDNQLNIVDEKVEIYSNSNVNINWLLIIYLLVTAFLLTRFFVNIFKILRKINMNPRLKYLNSNLVLIEENLVPHSFLNYIFINKTEYESGQIHKSILRHEHTHVIQKHSFDILFIELINIVLWVNPILFFYKRAIQLNHEFLADDGTLQHEDVLQTYQYLLLEKAGVQQRLILTSNFNFPTIKTRIIMMTKKSSKTVKFICTATIFPLLAFAIFLFSEKVVAQSAKKESTKKTEFQVKKSNQSEVSYTSEGVPRVDLDDFHNSLLKFTRISKNGKNRNLDKVPDFEKARLEVIYKKMSKAQQDDQDFRFYPPLAPLPKITPTKKLFDAFKDPIKYGIWIDGKKVKNSKLNNYKNTDFAEYFISKLYGKAKNTVTYKYQLDMMTIPYYKKYIDETNANKELFLSWNHQKLFSEKKF